MLCSVFCVLCYLFFNPESFFVILQQNIFFMRIDIISAVPELLDSPLNHSILKRAKEKGLVEIFVHSLRD